MGREKYLGIDIFSGAGGLSLGAQHAGIKIAHAVEKDIHAAKTFQDNHPETTVITRDISEVKTSMLAVKDPFIVFGGPPCQGFSLPNSKTRNTTNEKNHLYLQFVRFVEELSPRWFLFENVEGIASFNKGKTVQGIKDHFRSLGYGISNQVLTASDHGVPQNRNRFFMIGNRLGINFEFPKKKKKKVTVRQAISDLPNLKNGQQSDELPYKLGSPSNYGKQMRNGALVAKQNFVSKNNDFVLERYKYIKPGENWRSIPERLMGNYKDRHKCYSGIYKRLSPDLPSVVISNYRKNMLIHPEQDRGLSVREAARIQSFPDDFVFKGTLMHMQQQIGNAVPPLLAKA